jgi:hypothetical protein
MKIAVFHPPHDKTMAKGTCMLETNTRKNQRSAKPPQAPAATTIAEAAEALEQISVMRALSEKSAALRAELAPLKRERERLRLAAVRPVAPGTVVDVNPRAAALLNGTGHLAGVVGKSDGERLFELEQQCAGYERALELAESAHFRESVAAASALLRACEGEWRQLMRERAEALMAMRRINRACVQFKRRSAGCRVADCRR